MSCKTNFAARRNHNESETLVNKKAFLNVSMLSTFHALFQMISNGVTFLSTLQTSANDCSNRVVSTSDPLRVVDPSNFVDQSEVVELSDFVDQREVVDLSNNNHDDDGGDNDISEDVSIESPSTYKEEISSFDLKSIEHTFSSNLKPVELKFSSNLKQTDPKFTSIKKPVDLRNLESSAHMKPVDLKSPGISSTTRAVNANKVMLGNLETML